MRSSVTVMFCWSIDETIYFRLLFGSEADKIARLAKKEGLGRVVIGEQD